MANKICYNKSMSLLLRTTLESIRECDARIPTFFETTGTMI